MNQSHAILPQAPYPAYQDYLHAVGGKAVEKARQMDPEAVLAEVGRSGLRGRGGAGFPTGIKWSTIFRHHCRTRSVVCNAAEGEPGTFKDRALIRQNPYAILEGMLVAAHVVGTHDLRIVIKASFVKETARLERALEEMERFGVLEGLTPSIVQGPEEYLFGEEKALLTVLDGNGPLPREAHYPPYELGLGATPESPNPALVNNAETFAHVPSILIHGADSFRQIGTPDTPGTILLTLCGDIARPGVYETPAGIPLARLFEELGGGPRPGRRFRAALSGVSTGVIDASRFDTPADFESLKMIGSGLGSAGFILVDDSRSIPRVAQTVARFLYVESCNQCTACKHGLRMCSQAIDELFDPETATTDDLPRALYGARSAPQANRCYLPVGASILIPSLLVQYQKQFDAQLLRPQPTSEPYVIPKIIDYDHEKGDFIYDPYQPHKNPDWTYSLPAEIEEGPAVTVPAPEPAGDVSIRIAADVANALTAMGARDLDRAVDEVLRDWLRKKER